jgi:hypothetical protein
MPEMDMKQFNEKVNRWMKDFPEEVEKALGAGAAMVHGEAIDKHLSGPRMGKGIGSNTNATLQPRTGNLKNSISFRVLKKGTQLTGQVGNWKNPLVYARVHEEGLGHAPKRPFLKSSLRAKKKQIVDFILKAMMRSYTNA